jgi:AraC-like DNA-binding protein
LYVVDVAEARARLRPWSPAVPGIREVLHADFPPGAHDYPMHAHDTWTLLLIDRGVVRYHLEGGERLARPGEITLLPPRVPHDGTAATADEFRKRVLYLDGDCLAADLVAAAVDDPARRLPALGRQIAALHAELADPVDLLAAEHHLVEVVESLDGAWAPDADALRPAGSPAAGGVGGSRLAERLRDLLDADVPSAVSLHDAAAVFDVSRSALVHAFRRRFGMSPHRYVVSRRLDLARALLLDGVAAADAAVLAGFHDQAHLSRHFKRLLGVPPGAWVTAAA